MIIHQYYKWNSNFMGAITNINSCKKSLNSNYIIIVLHVWILLIVIRHFIFFFFDLLTPRRKRNYGYGNTHHRGRKRGTHLRDVLPHLWWTFVYILFLLWKKKIEIVVGKDYLGYVLSLDSAVNLFYIVRLKGHFVASTDELRHGGWSNARETQLSEIQRFSRILLNRSA